MMPVELVGTLRTLHRVKYYYHEKIDDTSTKASRARSEKMVEKELSESVMQAVRTGHTIQAIKRLRMEKGLGLKEAKDIIDREIDDYRRANPQAPMMSKSTWWPKVVVVALIAVAFYCSFGHRPRHRRSHQRPQTTRPPRRHPRHLGRRIRSHGLLPRRTHARKIWPRSPPSLLLDVDGWRRR